MTDAQVSQLTASITELSTTLSARIDALRDHVAEEFALAKVWTMQRFDGVDWRLDRVEVRLDTVERRVSRLDVGVEDGFAMVEERLTRLERPRRR